MGLGWRIKAKRLIIQIKALKTRRSISIELRSIYRLKIDILKVDDL